MNLRDLHYVATVADTQNFSKAAERCHVSQPALSTQIRKLEEYLGVKIFDRTGREVVLTRTGETVLAHTRRIIRESEALLASTRAVRDSSLQPLSLGCFPTLAPYLFPRVVPELIQAHPQIELSLIEERTDELLQRLNDGKIDAAVLALPVAAESMRMHTLFSEEFLVCLRSDHRLAVREQLFYEDLAGEDILLLEEGHCMRDQSLAVCAMQGLNFRRDYSATSLETLRQMVVAGAGITLIPRLAIEKQDPRLVYLPITPGPPQRTIVVLWAEDNSRSSWYEQTLMPVLNRTAEQVNLLSTAV